MLVLTTNACYPSTNITMLYGLYLHFTACSFYEYLEKIQEQTFLWWNVLQLQKHNLLNYAMVAADNRQQFLL